MRKVTIFYFIFIVLINAINVVNAGMVKLTTFYAAPIGAYDRLRLVPRSSAGLVCDASMEGLMYYDSGTNDVYLCRDTGVATWDILGGVWKQENVGGIGDIFLRNVFLDLYVGIDAKDPEFRLTLDKGNSIPDGGILAIGTLDYPIGTYPSLTTLNTAGAGTRLIWYPKKAAFRAGYVDGTQWDDSNITGPSVGIGKNDEVPAGVAIGISNASAGGGISIGEGNIPAGGMMVSMGLQTHANGICSFSAGEGTSSAGESAAFGYHTKITTGVFAVGEGTDAYSVGSVAMGRYNVETGDTVNWVDTDPIFVIGNGSDDLNRHNALTILKNGSVGLNTSDVEFRLTLDKGETTPDGGILAIGTLDYPVGSYPSLTTLNTAGAGTRFIWYPRKAALRAGYVNGTQWDDVNIGIGSIAIGKNVKAAGDWSVALGEDTSAGVAVSSSISNHDFSFGKTTSASGWYSIAGGLDSIASGQGAVSLGDATKAEGSCSVSMGKDTVAKGDFSVSVGIGTYTEVADSFVMGRYNIPAVDSDPSTVSGDENLFVIGNGTSSSSTHNIFTVLSNGNIGIGINDPKSTLHVKGYIQIDTVTAPPPKSACKSFYAGRMIFDTTNNCLYICSGSNWISKVFTP